MFTVIVLSRTAQRRFDEWKEIFLPFIEDGRIAVTDWTHPNTPSDLARAIPGLAEAVKGQLLIRMKSLRGHTCKKPDLDTRIFSHIVDDGFQYRNKSCFIQ